MSEGPPDFDELLSTEAATPTSDGYMQIDRYRMLHKLGEGGMGEVWLAEQTEPIKRRVALKIIKQGMDTKQVVVRFEAERQALALMDHPAVAKVFDAGRTPRGNPYFVMEYVKGIPLTAHCDRSKMSTHERLELFREICSGVQHAHQKAIIHRDLKPSNVLVVEQDGKRFPKIIDFGVAKATAQKLTERTMFTELGVLIGTPEYMSPEQAELTGEDVDTRTDVYSLGVMLYELLVGALPFDPKELRSGGFEGIRKKIREVEPPRPSTRLSTLGDGGAESASRRSVDPPTLRRQLRGDLDWITMRALEKDRARRYGSPMELAADVGRYLAHEPVLARPPSTAYRVGKFVRRHKLGVAAVTVLVLGVGAGIVGSTVGLIQARRSEARALAEARRSERVTGFLTGMLSDVSPERMGELLREDLRERVKQSRSRGARAEAETASALSSLDHALSGVRLTDSGIVLVNAEILEPMLGRIDEELGDDPVIAARLYYTIGEFYLSLGRPEAIEAHEKALGLRRSSLGEDHIDTLKTKLELALMYWTVGRTDEHLELVTDVAERGARVLGAEHQLTLQALGEVADAYMHGPYDEATVREAQEQRVALLETERRVLGEDHEQTVFSMQLVAGIFSSRGDLARAEPLYREALEASRRVLGEEDGATVRARFNLATYFLRTGKYEEAESEFLWGLQLGERRRGAASQWVIAAAHNLGVICDLQGRSDEAVRYMRRALAATRQWRGDNTPDALGRMRSLAGMLSRTGDHAEAEALFVKVSQAARETGLTSAETSATLGLATLYLRQGDAVRAESHFEGVRESLEESAGPYQAAATAEYHVVAGDHEAASRKLKRAVELGYPRAWIATDPRFAPLRGNPEFDALVAGPDGLSQNTGSDLTF